MNAMRKFIRKSLNIRVTVKTSIYIYTYIPIDTRRTRKRTRLFFLNSKDTVNELWKDIYPTRIYAPSVEARASKQRNRAMHVRDQNCETVKSLKYVPKI